jgi:PAS domain S-box-containing protein
MTATLARDTNGKAAFVVRMAEDVTARKQAQDALRVTEERLLLASRAARDCIYDWDLASGRVWRSEAFQELVGPGEPVGDDSAWWQDRVHPDDRERLLEAGRRAFDGADDSWRGEYRFRRADGTYAQVEGRGYIVRDARGKAVRMVGSVTDVTSRRIADQSLKQSQAKLEIVLQNTTDAIWSVDREHRLVTFNAWFSDRFGRLFGFQPALGQRPEELMPEPLRTYWTRVYDRALRGATFSVEQQFEFDGGPRCFDVSVNPLRVEGEIVGAAVVGRDVTLYKKALGDLQRQTDALEQQTSLFLSLLDSISDGVVMANERGRLLIFNREAERILGAGLTDSTPDQWSSVYGLYLPDGLTLYPAQDLPLARAIRGESVDDAEVLVLSESLPEPVWLSVSTRPLFGADGSLRGGVAAFRDVTESRRTQEARDAAQAVSEQMLLAYDRDRQLLAYEIHDGLIQEVTAALMHLESLRPPDTPGEAPADDLLHLPRELLRRALEEGRRLIGGLRPPMIDELGIVAALDHLVAEERGRSSIQIDWQPPWDFPRQGPLAEATLFRIAQEALTNVRRHSQAPQVSVRLFQDQAHACLEVRDAGRGFRPADVPKRRYGLLGIRERARLLGGQATIVSAPDAGATVRVELPLAPVAPSGPEPPKP